MNNVMYTFTWLRTYSYFFVQTIGFLFLLGSWSCSSSQDVNPNDTGLFMKFLGGARDETANAMAETSDGGVVIAGSSTSFNNMNTRKEVYFAKTDANGNREWQVDTLPLENSLEAEALDVQILDNGNILLLGYLTTGQDSTDFLLVEAEPTNGGVVEVNTFGQADVNEIGFHLEIADNGDILIIGSALNSANGNSMYLIRLNAAKEIIFETPYGLIDTFDEVGTILEMSANNSDSPDNPDLIWCGTINRDPTSDMRVVRADAFGNLKWDFPYGQRNDKSETGVDMKAVEDGYIVLGTTTDSSGDSDIFVIKIDFDGNLLWELTLEEALDQEAKSLAITEDGGFIIVGTTNITAENSDVYMVKVDTGQSVAWTQAIGGDNPDKGYFIRQTSDLGYLILSTITFTNNQVMGLIKTDEFGQTLYK